MTISFSATGLPPEASIDSVTGIISATAPVTVGTYNIVATGSNSQNSVNQSFEWVVNPAYVLPVFETLLGSGTITPISGGYTFASVGTTGFAQTVAPFPISNKTGAYVFQTNNTTSTSVNVSFVDSTAGVGSNRFSVLKSGLIGYNISGGSGFINTTTFTNGELGTAWIDFDTQRIYVSNQDASETYSGDYTSVLPAPFAGLVGIRVDYSNTSSLQLDLILDKDEFPHTLPAGLPVGWKQIGE